jgi:multidrug efflux system outer membrane protein
VEAAGRSHALAGARYRSGVIGYLEALDAQRSLYSEQQDLIDLLQVSPGAIVALNVNHSHS